VFISYHYVGWAIIYFLEVGGFVKLCAIGQHSKASTHLLVNISKFYAYYSMENPSQKVTSLPTRVDHHFESWGCNCCD
jgi:hypothetical protein